MLRRFSELSADYRRLRTTDGAPVAGIGNALNRDSPNSAGVVIDAIRSTKLGPERGIGGPLEAPLRLLP